mmetsp:Transcript_16123/g.43833  ORF Transcript_16123/g.43833 Transcript_16123/m.43833 type:complete len:261 (+) Transcript_16123:221-1003(+)
MDGVAGDSVLRMAVTTLQGPPAVGRRDLLSHLRCHEIEATLHVGPARWGLASVGQEVVADGVPAPCGRAERGVIVILAGPGAAAEHVGAACRCREVVEGGHELTHLQVGVQVHLRNVRDVELRRRVGRRRVPEPLLSLPAVHVLRDVQKRHVGLGWPPPPDQHGIIVRCIVYRAGPVGDVAVHGIGIAGHVSVGLVFDNGGGWHLACHKGDKDIARGVTVADATDTADTRLLHPRVTDYSAVARGVAAQCREDAEDDPHI